MSGFIEERNHDHPDEGQGMFFFFLWGQGESQWMHAPTDAIATFLFIFLTFFSALIRRILAVALIVASLKSGVFCSSLMKSCCWWATHASSKQTEGSFSELPWSGWTSCGLVRAQLCYPVRVQVAQCRTGMWKGFMHRNFLNKMPYTKWLHLLSDRTEASTTRVNCSATCSYLQ